jgi:hypothetical protein
MRTTIDFSDEMFRKLKAVAAMYGMSIKRFLHNAVEHELEKTKNPEVSDRKVDLPRLSPRTSSRVTGADLARTFPTIPKPDPEYWDILTEIIHNQPPANPPHDPH